MAVYTKGDKHLLNSYKIKKSWLLVDRNFQYTMFRGGDPIEIWFNIVRMEGFNKYCYKSKNIEVIFWNDNYTIFKVEFYDKISGESIIEDFTEQIEGGMNIF